MTTDETVIAVRAALDGCQCSDTYSAMQSRVMGAISTEPMTASCVDGKVYIDGELVDGGPAQCSDPNIGT
jgi:hypothetical protein